MLGSNDVAINPISDPRDDKLLDVLNPSVPGLLASVPAVKQRLSKPDTGTLFLLNAHGVIVVRWLSVEQEHQIDYDSQWGN